MSTTLERGTSRHDQLGGKRTAWKMPSSSNRLVSKWTRGLGDFKRGKNLTGVECGSWWGGIREGMGVVPSLFPLARAHTIQYRLPNEALSHSHTSPGWGGVRVVEGECYCCPAARAAVVGPSQTDVYTDKRCGSQQVHWKPLERKGLGQAHTWSGAEDANYFSFKQTSSPGSDREGEGSRSTDHLAP